MRGMRIAKIAVFKEKMPFAGLWHGRCSKKMAGIDRSVPKSGRILMISVAAMKRFKAVFAGGGTGRTLVAVILILGVTVGYALSGNGPWWKIGRAVIQERVDNAGQRELSLELSLRNTGRPGRAPVRILARWDKVERGPGRCSMGPRGRVLKKGLDGFDELGRFTTEVALRKTSILRIPLRRLGAVPAGTGSVVVVVITGSRETDRRTIGLRPVPKPRRFRRGP